MPTPRQEPVPLPEIGLCSACGFATHQRSARGSSFWRCRRAETDARFMRYPPLPVARCPGFERGRPRVGGGG